ncbi:MAG: SLBB domain-containing protein, partial [Cyanobacteria bacterium J06639_1]
VDVRVLHYGAAIVHVSGAVFDPGTVEVNREPLDLQAGSLQSLTQIPGDAPRRRLTDAIRAAGGITPIADLQEVTLIRDGREQTFNLTGIFDGTPYPNPFLLDGDRAIVPEDRFRNEWVRPSIVTPPDVTVFLSSTTIPSSTNSSANDNGTLVFPYGTHFSQALGPANCLGGTQVSNAKRRAVLVRTDRLTGQVFTLDRRVEDIARDSDASAENPFLMAGDLVACYDSTVTNVREFFRTLGDIILPFGLFWNR